MATATCSRRATARCSTAARRTAGKTSDRSRPRRSGSFWGRAMADERGRGPGELRPGYELKLNSYDLGVDIELYDAVQRLRFEHPGVGAVVVTSGKERIFCAGANIRMLSQSAHGWKVNFCKFTNETRNAIEEATAESKQVYLTCVNGPCAGGGYELALATDWIVMADDGNTAVSLPEVPLLAVLPGTGGLTRLVDKRRVRRDRADFFCTTEEGGKGQRADAGSPSRPWRGRSRATRSATAGSSAGSPAAGAWRKSRCADPRCRRPPTSRRSTSSAACSGRSRSPVSWTT